MMLDSCLLDINTKDALRAWLRNFLHGDCIFIDIDGYRIEFTVIDGRGHTQIMTMPSIYAEHKWRMCGIRDLLDDTNATEKE